MTESETGKDELTGGKYYVAPDVPLKRVNLALQGGGAHGAFAWGVIDKLLEDGRLSFEGISGASAGAMNAVVLAYGMAKGGPSEARARLNAFWHAISSAGRLYNPVQRMPWEFLLHGWKPDHSVSYEVFNTITRWFSPYQLNPFDFNPLREVLVDQVDFAELNATTRIKLFLSATNVRNGKVKVFNTQDVTADAVLASACLPFLFKSVEIEDEYYWDGGYMGNPSLYPFFRNTDTADIIIVHINPLERAAPPMMPNEIVNRVNEISFNASLLKELRAIAFVHKLFDRGWIKDEFKHELKYNFIHSIRADEALKEFSVASKFSSDWNFLQHLRDRGRNVAQTWLDANFAQIGVASTVDIRKEFMGEH